MLLSSYVSISQPQPTTRRASFTFVARQYDLKGEGAHDYPFKRSLLLENESQTL